MSKIVSGYVLDIATAAGLAAVPVTLKDAGDNHTLTAADAFGLTTNPSNTDANGLFQFSMDLAPGPFYADAAIPGGNHDRRYSLEQMAIGGHWTSDLGPVMQMFGDGVIRSTLNEMAVTFSGSIQQLTVATGNAIVQGYMWTLESGPFSKAITMNTTVGLTNRKSIVVLRQYTAGAKIGKQVIDIVYGTVTDVKPALAQGASDGAGSTIWEFPLATFNSALNAGTSSLDTDDRVFTSTVGSYNRANVPISDEFLAALTQFTTQTANGGVVSEGPLTADANHPGIWTIATQGSNNGRGLFQGALLYTPDLSSWELVFQPAGSGTMIQRYGFFISTGDQFGAVINGVCAEFDNSGKADTDLVLRKYVSSANTDLAHIPLVGGHWYRLNWVTQGTTGAAGTLTIRDLSANPQVFRSVAVSGLSVTHERITLSLQAKTNANYVAAVDWFAGVLSGMNR